MAATIRAALAMIVLGLGSQRPGAPASNRHEPVSSEEETNMSDYVPLTPIGEPAGQPPPLQQSFPLPPPKKPKVKVWVLVGSVIAMVLGGYYVRLMQKSPALAVAKMMVAANPDVLELVSVDDEKRLITMRNKQTSETFTLDMDAKHMSMATVVAIPKDNEFYIGRDKVAMADIPTRIRNILKDKPAPDQVVYIKQGKEVKYGTVVSVIDSIRDAGFDRIGLVAEKDSSPKLPGWFPSYPGAVVPGTFSTDSNDGESFGFSTNDSIEKVMKFYEENLKQAGLKVTANTVRQKGVVSKGSLASEDPDKKRNAFVTAISEKGQTQVTIVFAPK
jgi:biopolymer transport protein ExbD